MNNPAWKAAVYLQHHWHCCKFSSSWSGIEKCQRTKSRRRHVRNLYSTNFALILPLLQIYNLYMPVKPFLINTQAYTAPQGLPQVKWRFPFAQPLQVRCGATKHGEERLQARATLKDRSIISSASILLFINLTKPLTRQDCSHTRCMRILRGEAHPNCCSRGSRAATTLQRRRRTLMEKKTCNSFSGHPRNPDSTFSWSLCTSPYSCVVASGGVCRRLANKKNKTISPERNLISVLKIIF